MEHSAAPIYFDAETNLWSVTHPDDVRRILLDSATFGPENALDAITHIEQRALRELAKSGFRLPATLANNSGATHPGLRRLSNDFIGPRKATEARPLITEVTDKQLDVVEDELRRDGSCNLVNTLARGLPCEVIFRLLNADTTSLDEFKRWSAAALQLFWGRPDEDEQVVLARDVGEFHRWLRRELQDPRPGIFSEISRHHDAPTVNEQVGFCFFMLIAGQETTAQLISLTLERALRDRDLWRRAASDEKTVVALVDEVLDEDPPINTWRRVVNRPTEIAGVELEPGAQLLLTTTGSVCPHADRGPQQLTFGLGRHRCPGAELSKIEAFVALKQLAKRFPSLELVGKTTPTRQRLTSFNAPISVDVRIH